MAVTLKYIAQAAMDNFLQNYRSNSDFWTLDDFMLRAATTIAEFYQKSYDAQYQMNRAEKADEVISFAPEILSEQVLRVINKDGEKYATLEFPAMSFLHDNQSTGIQDVLPLSPNNAQLERSNIYETYQYNLLPFSNRIFWRMRGMKILFFNNGRGNINEINVLYVPAVMDRDGNVLEDTLIADGVADMAINVTPLKLKQQKEGVVIKQTNDLNANPILQTELNETALPKK